MKTSFLHKIIGTAGGLGYAPFAPGTFGSLGGLASGWLIIHFLQPLVAAAVLLLLIFIFFAWGVHSSNKLIPEWGEDPSKIVIDEVVGMWISMFLMPDSTGILIAAFVFFRLLDIYKPFGIRKFENFTNGWGIMLDDVAAGCVANIALQIVVIVSKQFV